MKEKREEHQGVLKGEKDTEKNLILLGLKENTAVVANLINQVLSVQGIRVCQNL